MAQEARAEDFVPPDEQMAHPRGLSDLVAAYDFDALAARVTNATSAAANVFGLTPARSALTTGLSKTMEDALHLEHAALHPPAVVARNFVEDATNGGRKITDDKTLYEMSKQWLSEDLTRSYLTLYEDQNYGKSEVAMKHGDDLTKEPIAVVVNLGGDLDYPEFSKELSELLLDAHRRGLFVRREYKHDGPSNPRTPAV